MQITIALAGPPSEGCTRPEHALPSSAEGFETAYPATSPTNPPSARRPARRDEEFASFLAVQDPVLERRRQIEIQAVSARHSSCLSIQPTKAGRRLPNPVSITGWTRALLLLSLEARAT
jgi:hypothetical protein